jgi:hypothetical protein
VTRSLASSSLTEAVLLFVRIPSGEVHVWYCRNVLHPTVNGLFHPFNNEIGQIVPYIVAESVAALQCPPLQYGSSLVNFAMKEITIPYCYNDCVLCW